MRLGGLRWSERAANFLTLGGTVAALGSNAVLLHEDLARELADRHGVGIVWTVLCVKSVRLLDPAPSYPLLRISRGYRLSETEPVGFLQPEVDETREAPMGVVMRTLLGFAGSGCTIRRCG